MKRRKHQRQATSLIIHTKINKNISNTTVRLNLDMTDYESNFTKKNHRPRFTTFDPAYQTAITDQVGILGFLGSEALRISLFPELEKSSLGQLIRHYYKD